MVFVSSHLIAPWCGHCKAFAQDYNKIAKYLKGVAKVGAVDMTKDQVLTRVAVYS